MFLNFQDLIQYASSLEVQKSKKFSGPEKNSLKVLLSKDGRLIMSFDEIPISDG